MNLRFIRSVDDKLHRWKVKDLILGLLAVSALFAMSLIWPLGVMKDTVVSSSGAEYSRSTGNVTTDCNVFQSFIPQYGYIRSIGILVDRYEGQHDAGNLLLEIYDGAGAQQRQANFKMPQVGDKSQGYFDIPVNLKVIPGAGYTIRIFAFGTEEEPIHILYRTKSGAGPVENQAFDYAGDVIPNASLACSYTYGSPLGKKQILAYDLFFLMLFFMGAALTRWLAVKWKRLDEKLTIGTAIRSILTAGAVWIWIFCYYYFFIRKLFGGDGWDFGIYAVAMVLGMGMFLYFLWKAKLPVIALNKRKALFASAVQILGFAYYFNHYAPYFNSGNNYGHYINGSYMSIALALVVLSLSELKLILHWRNLIFSAIYWAACAASFLHKVYDLSPDDRILYIWIYVGGWLWGVVAVATIVKAVRRQLPRMVWGYALLVLAFFASTWMHRYDKWWPIMMAVCFGLLYLQKLEREQKLLLLTNFCRGIVLSFWYSWMFCLLHRPYHYNNFSRYNMTFSSVAMTGLYLVFVYAAALLLCIAQYRRDHKLCRMWFHYLTLGGIISYVYMSVSRTAMITIACMTLLTMGVIWLLENGKDKRQAFLMPVILLLCFVVLFPLVYTTTRCVPAIVNDPVHYPYEEFRDTIYKNERKDSPKYMTFYHFLELSSGRVLTLFQGYLDRDKVLDEEISGEYASTVLTRDMIRELYDAGGNESNDEITNGRLAIAKLYLSRLNWEGHDSVVITIGDTIYAHAHNSFIQVAYDHGIVCGVLFLLLMVVTLIRSILYGVRYYRQDGAIVFTPLLFLAAFTATAMVEFVFLPVIPLGFGLLFIIYPLLSPIEKVND